MHWHNAVLMLLFLASAGDAATCGGTKLAAVKKGAQALLAFGPAGKLSVQIKRITGDVKLVVKGTDIWDGFGPYTGSMTCTANLRVTDTACGPGFNVPCTVVDFPFSVGATCVAGKCASSYATAIAAIPGAVQAGDGGNIEVGQVICADSDGDAAFRMGLFLP